MQDLKTILQHPSPATNRPELLRTLQPSSDDDIEKTIQEYREIWIRQSGLSEELRQKTFDNYDGSRLPKAYKAAIDYKNGSMIFLSPDIYGVGKTHLAAAIANRLLVQDPTTQNKLSGATIMKPCPVIFVTEGRLLGAIRATYNNNNGTETDIIRQVCAPKLLIIDDVGKVRPRDYSHLQGVYFRIIDKRYTTGKDVILTTNLTMQQLEQHIGGASADRLCEMVSRTGYINFAGPGMRGYYYSHKAGQKSTR
jgi:DNA replication protein DnaC